MTRIPDLNLNRSLEPIQRPSLPKQPEGENLAEVYQKSTDSLEYLYNKSTFKANGTSWQLTSPALGSGALNVKTGNGLLQATLDGQELEVKHDPGMSYESSGGAVGHTQERDAVDLPGGRKLHLEIYGSTIYAEFSQENSSVHLEMQFRTDQEAPHTVSFTQPRGFTVGLDSQRGLSIQERPQIGGPTHGHLTSYSGEQFVSRDWRDGFCSPLETTSQDEERVLKSASSLLSEGGALFAPHNL